MGLLTVGDNGDGTLVIGANGSPGVVISTDGVLGQAAGSSGLVVISETGSKWDAGGHFVLVGGGGTGALTVQNGGALVTGVGDIGTQSQGDGTVTVTGAGSNWQTGGIAMGDLGIGKLFIDDTATVTSTGQVTVGNQPSGQGILAVKNGSTLDASGANLILGSAGTATMNVQSGGTVKSAIGTLGMAAGSNAVATIDGAGSSWSVTGDLTVGVFGTGTLTVSNGGTLTNGKINANASAYIGYGSNASITNATNSVTVTGVGSTWTNYGPLTVSNYADGALTVSSGGAVTVTADAVIGYHQGATGIATVTGAGSSLTVGQTLFVGGDNVNSSLGFLVIANGGNVTVGNGAGIVNLGMKGDTTAMLMIGDAAQPAIGNSTTAPGTLNAAQVNLGQFAQINFSHNSTNYAFAPKLAGTGTIAQFNGTTILTADSSAFSGQTVVGGGTLAVNGSLGGTLNVLADGRLRGIGTIGDTAVSGTIAPGNSIGTLNVAGNILFNPNSIYEVEANAAGQADKIVATGTATINGGTVKVLAGAGNYAPATTYTILTANGGRTGTFGGVTSNLAFLDPTLSYDPNNVYLKLTRNSIGFANVGITPNQIATGNGAESLALGNQVYNAVLNLSGAMAQYAFDQLSGEIHASARTALIEDSHFVRNAAIDRLRAAFNDVGASTAAAMAYYHGGPQAVAAATERLAFWGQGFGSWGRTEGDGNAARLSRSTGGFLVGADGQAFETWRLGLLAGYSHTNFKVGERDSSGSSDNYHVGLYGGTRWGDLAFRTGAAYTWHDLSTSRSVIFPGFADSLTRNTNDGTAQVFGELGYGIRAGIVAFEPFANLAYVSLATDGFREQGGAAALSGASATTDATFTTLGLRGANAFTLGSANAAARGTVGWRHAFGDVTPLALLAFAGADPFTIAGVPITRDAAVFEAGLDFALSPSAIAGISYGGQFGSGFSDQSVKANFNLKF